MSLVKTLAGVLSLVLVSGIASAQDRPPYGPDVRLDQAKKMAAGALAEAQKNKWRVATAIVDNHGFLVYFEKMDDTQTAGVETAIEKARTAAMFRRPTKVMEDALNKGRASILGFPGVTPVDGGLPIMVDGRVLGGIGVSGVNADQDAQVAQAGLNALK
jgi:glc operon protein GlcG